MSEMLSFTPPRVFTDERGRLTRDGHLFLLGMYRRIGEASAPTIPEIAADVEAVELRTDTLEDRADVLEARALAHVIEDEGVAVTQRVSLNFVGAGVTVADSGGKTVVTIPGGGGGGGSIDDALALQALL